MEISKLLNTLSASTNINRSGEQPAAATSRSPERQSQQAGSTRVQLSALGQAKSAAAQAETTASRLQNNNPGTAAEASAAAQDRRANEAQVRAQQGFSLRGVAAYNRIATS